MDNWPKQPDFLALQQKKIDSYKKALAVIKENPTDNPAVKKALLTLAVETGETYF